MVCFVTLQSRGTLCLYSQATTGTTTAMTPVHAYIHVLHQSCVGLESPTSPRVLFQHTTSRVLGPNTETLERRELVLPSLTYVASQATSLLPDD